MQKKPVRVINTPEGRSSFVYIFTPTKRYNPTNDPAKDQNSYEMELMFDKATTDIRALMGVVNQAIEDQWPGGTMPPGVANPIQDGDTATVSMSDATLKCVKFPEYAGKLFIKVKSQNPVKVYRQIIEGQPAVEITSDNEFYAGCNCVVNVNVSAYHVGPSVGVNFYINGIMMTTAGERLGGGGGCDPTVFPTAPAGQMPNMAPQQQAPAPGGFQPQPSAPAGPTAKVGHAPQGQPAPQQQAVPQVGVVPAAPPVAQPQNQGQSVPQPGQPAQQGFPPSAPGGQVPQS